MFSQKAKRIINCLHDDATVPMDEIGSKVGITRQNVSTYLEKFTTGKILAYTIVENPNVLESRTFFIEIKTNPEEPDVVEFLEDITGVRSIDGIIGENSLVVKFAARNNVEFARVLDRVDEIITGTRFQHYKIIECLKTFKDGGKTFVNTGDGTAVHPQNATVSIDPFDEDILRKLSTMDDR
nr:Lrp/AsnC family transcriptional regulator [Candidatus Sigynarchaeota archaeon]